MVLEQCRQTCTKLKLMDIEKLKLEAQNKALHIADVSGSALFNADCMDIMPLIPDNSIDMILCDLPYGTTKCKWDVVIPFDRLWEQYNRIAKPNSCIALFGNEPFSSALRLSNLSAYRYDWYWQKDKAANFLFGNKMPLKVIEIISVFYSALPTYNPQKETNPKGISKRHLSPNPSKISKNVKEVMGDSWKETEMDETQNYHGKNYEADKLLPKQLIYFSREQRGKVHPTQKPVTLAEYLIKTYTKENETVLDNCMGSGTTGVACKNLNRKFIGIELDPKYFEIAKARVFG
jgi:site-specific DNA-methyltransferase (adenine-specific)